MKNILFRSLIGLAVSVASLSAGSVGFYNAGNANAAQVSAAIVAAGQTAVQLTDLSAASLASVPVVWILNGNNSAYGVAITGAVSDISMYVGGGGVLSFHDRFVTGAASILPGAAGVIFTRDFSDDANINVLNNTTLVTNGPGGIVDNFTLDGGSSSSHGYADISSLPAGAIAILSQGNANHVVDFSYRFGAGAVYYSTIPLDFYFVPAGANGASFRNIYAPNEVAYQASLAGAQIPEPSTIILLSAGLLGTAFLRRRRA